MPTKQLPPNPDLRHLKHQAHDLLKDHRDGKLEALQRLREFHPRFRGATDGEISSSKLTLADSHLAIAREHGFPSWARLQAHVRQPDASSLDRPYHERIEDPTFRTAVDLVDDGDVAGLRQHIRQHPRVVRQRVLFEGGNYFREPGLLEFVAENPVRHDSLPPNIVDVARVILEAGARDDRQAIDSTLGLVCSGRVAREYGVQLPLIEILCDHGADPNRAVPAALTHGEFEAVDALIRRGAAVSFAVAAALGDVEVARGKLAASDSEERHRGLALAAQHGRTEVVGLLVEAGEAPNRFNPIGCHAHATPLHQAALAGHAEVVRLLVRSGARVDIRDILFRGTPREWAEHGGQREVADYLAAIEQEGRA